MEKKRGQSTGSRAAGADASRAVRTRCLRRRGGHGRGGATVTTTMSSDASARLAATRRPRTRWGGCDDDDEQRRDPPGRVTTTTTSSVADGHGSGSVVCIRSVVVNGFLREGVVVNVFTDSGEQCCVVRVCVLVGDLDFHWGVVVLFGLFVNVFTDSGDIDQPGFLESRFRSGRSFRPPRKILNTSTTPSKLLQQCAGAATKKRGQGKGRCSREASHEDSADNSKTSRRKWIHEEDVALVNAMVEMVAKYPEARPLRLKSFPHYENCCIIFRNDRATGEDARAPEDAFEDINDVHDSSSTSEPLTAPTEEFDATPTSSRTRTTTADGSGNQAKKKRKVSNDVYIGDQMVALAQIVANEISKVTSVIRVEHDLPIGVEWVAGHGEEEDVGEEGFVGLQKLIVLAVLAVWSRLTSRSASLLDWSITLFSLSTLPNTLVMGIPLLKRGAKLLIAEQFPDNTAASIISFEVDSDIISLDGKEPLETEAQVGEDGKLHVTFRKSTSSRSDILSRPTSLTPRMSNLTNAEIYSLQSSRNPNPRGSSFNRSDFHWSWSWMFEGSSIVALIEEQTSCIMETELLVEFSTELEEILCLRSLHCKPLFEGSFIRALIKEQTSCILVTELLVEFSTELEEIFSLRSLHCKPLMAWNNKTNRENPHSDHVSKPTDHSDLRMTSLRDWIFLASGVDPHRTSRFNRDQSSGIQKQEGESYALCILEWMKLLWCGKKTRKAVADPGTVKGEVRCTCGWPCSEGFKENSCLK
ncbi:hypothetical protein Syun_029462 [Stephania yunnanensis]|uniref:Uncharacterized protein n=1 Tax=Stephania yunnanensis TaxID=152371 RepID=A0AAP0ED88_9MAGN